MSTATELLKTQLRRHLPPLISLEDLRITKPSTGNEFLAKRFMQSWDGFLDDVMSTIQSSPNMSARVSALDASPEFVIVSNETGVQGRFFQHVGQVMSKLYSRSGQDVLTRMRFHDAQVNATVLADESKKFPDIIVSTIDDDDGITSTEARMVGELKTPWTLRLGSVNVHRRDLLWKLQKHMGQLVSYMRFLNLKYGFLSTYEHTIFVRRTADFKFELSEPVSFDATNPSIRECFFYVGTLAAGLEYSFSDTLGDGAALRVPDGTFSNSPRNVKGKSWGGLTSGGGGESSTLAMGHASRTASYSKFEEAAHTARDILNNHDFPPTFSQVTNKSTFFESPQDGIRKVELVQQLRASDSGGKVYEGNLGGRIVIVKYWPEALDGRLFCYSNELAVYTKILPPSRFTPKLIGYGQVVLSNELGKGNIVLLEKVPGEIFGQKVWAKFDERMKEDFKTDLRAAFEYLRSYNLVQADARKDNVLWNPDKRQVILLDMEQMYMNDDNDGIEGMEIDSILDMECAI